MAHAGYTVCSSGGKIYRKRKGEAGNWKRGEALFIVPYNSHWLQ